MTPEGFARMREELDTFMRKERPEVVKVVSWAAGNGDRSENGDYIYGKKRLREIDRRVRYLSKRLANAEVVDQAKRGKTDQVFFGATVTTANEKGEERTIRIVGVDEVDLAKGHVSWISPIAKALLRAEEGDVVKLRTPPAWKSSRSSRWSIASPDATILMLSRPARSCHEQRDARGPEDLSRFTRGRSVTSP